MRHLSIYATLPSRFGIIARYGEKGNDESEPTDWTTLGEFATNLGPPSFVGWGIAPTERALIWSEKGILLFTSTKMLSEPSGAKGAKPTLLVLFMPEPIADFKGKAEEWSWDLPFARLSLTNRFAPGADREHEDTLPQDPYDWETLTQP